MRITPNHARLRTVAITSCTLGAWFFVQTAALADTSSILLTILTAVGAMLLCACGLAFWILAADRRAGIIFDPKGIMLNLGHSAAFVDWDNIAVVGITTRRRSLFSLGSRKQIGLQLHDPERYLQSYETRLPAANGPLASALWSMQAMLGASRRVSKLPTSADLSVLRRSTGYELLIPATMVDGDTEAFLDLVEYYRVNRTQRRILRTETIFSM